MEFECYHQWNNHRKESWKGRISTLSMKNGIIEMSISSRSGLWVVVGNSSRGRWACIPDYQAGCYLSFLNDTFYNTEKIYEATNNIVDAITIAEALKKVHEVYPI